MMYLTLAILGALTLLLWGVLGARKALWISWPVCYLLVPSKMSMYLFGGIAIGSQLVPLMLLPGLFSEASRESGPKKLRWCLADSIMLAMFVCQNISQIINGKYALMTSVAFFLLWPAPYILARLAMGSERGIQGMLKPLCICLGILCIGMLLEALTGINAFRAVTGLRMKSEIRSGLHRARGTMTHPIFQGIVLVLMLPLALEAAARAKLRGGPIWWRVLPWLLFAAVVGTVSRGPAGAAIATVSIYVFFQKRAFRLPIAATWVVLAGVLLLAPESVKSTLLSISGEDKYFAENERIVEVDNADVQYTGSDHRWLLFHAYADALKNAGFFGYGYGLKVSLLGETFKPFSVWFYSIDNNFIAHVLSYGYLGSFLFFSLVLVTLWHLIRVGRKRNDALGRLAAGMFGSILAVNVALFSVAMTNDYVVFWPFAMGLGVSVAQLATERAGVKATARVAANGRPRSWAWQPAAVVAPTGGASLLLNPNNDPRRARPM